MLTLTATQEAIEAELHASGLPTEALIHAANRYANGRVQNFEQNRWKACNALAAADLTLAIVCHRIS